MSITGASIEYVDIYDLELSNRQHGHHWFDKDTKRFFSSRTGAYAYRGPGGTFFVSSEQGPSGPRAYTVRQALENGAIETIGAFQGYRSRSGADRRARALAAGAE
jgi:hypothetical protein